MRTNVFEYTYGKRYNIYIVPVITGVLYLVPQQVPSYEGKTKVPQ